MEVWNQFNAFFLRVKLTMFGKKRKKLNDSAYKSALIGYTADTALIRTEIAKSLLLVSIQ